MNYIDDSKFEGKSPRVILERVYEEGISSDKGLLSNRYKKYHVQQGLNQLLERGFIKYLERDDEKLYFMSYEGILFLTRVDSEAGYDYTEYIRRIRWKLNIHYIEVVQDIITRVDLASEQVYIFKDLYEDPHFLNYLRSQNYVSFMHVDFETLGTLIINGKEYYVIAEELMKSKEAYDRIFKIFKNYLKVREQEKLEKPEGIIILRALGGEPSDKKRESLKHLEFRLIFDSFVDVLAEFKEELRLLYFSVHELEARIKTIINKHEDLTGIFSEINRGIGKNDKKYSLPDKYKNKSDNELDEIARREGKSYFEVRTIKVNMDEDYINVYSWNGYPAFELNNKHYLLLQSEGGDSNSWLKNIHLYKMFLKEKLDTKLICYYKIERFEPLLNKLQVRKQRSFEASYYDSLYLIDLRGKEDRWGSFRSGHWETYWTSTPGDVFETLLNIKEYLGEEYTESQ